MTVEKGKAFSPLNRPKEHDKKDSLKAQACCCCQDEECIDLILITKGFLAAVIFLIVCFVALFDGYPDESQNTKNATFAIALSVFITIADLAVLTVINVMMNAEIEIDIKLTLKLVRFWRNINIAFIVFIMLGMLVTQTFVVGAFILLLHGYLLYVVCEYLRELEHTDTLASSFANSKQQEKEAKLDPILLEVNEKKF